MSAVSGHPPILIQLMPGNIFSMPTTGNWTRISILRPMGFRWGVARIDLPFGMFHADFRRKISRRFARICSQICADYYFWEIQFLNYLNIFSAKIYAYICANLREHPRRGNITAGSQPTLQDTSLHRGDHYRFLRTPTRAQWGTTISTYSSLISATVMFQKWNQLLLSGVINPNWSERDWTIVESCAGNIPGNKIMAVIMSFEISFFFCFISFSVGFIWWQPKPGRPLSWVKYFSEGCITFWRFPD